MSERVTGETMGPGERDTLRSVLKEYPVRLAVLFGSQATGTAGHESDVDIAVEFEPHVSRAERVETVLPMLTDVMGVLGRDDIDLSVFGDLDPMVGRLALETGIVLVGSTERLRHHRRAFEHLTVDEPSLRERAERVRTRLRQ